MCDTNKGTPAAKRQSKSGPRRATPPTQQHDGALLLVLLLLLLRTPRPHGAVASTDTCTTCLKSKGRPMLMPGDGDGDADDPDFFRLSSCVWRCVPAQQRARMVWYQYRHCMATACGWLNRRPTRDGAHTLNSPCCEMRCTRADLQRQRRCPHPPPWRPPHGVNASNDSAQSHHAFPRHTHVRHVRASGSAWRERRGMAVTLTVPSLAPQTTAAPTPTHPAGPGRTQRHTDGM